MPNVAQKRWVLVYGNAVPRAFVYEFVFLPDEPYPYCAYRGMAFYVGRTGALATRASGHASKQSKCRKLRQRLRLLNARPKDMMRLVHELPDGAPVERINELEAFFICKRDTIHDPKTERGDLMCNAKTGDGYVVSDGNGTVVDLTHERYLQIEQELASGFAHPSTWTATETTTTTTTTTTASAEASAAAPTELEKAKATVEVLQDFVEDSTNDLEAGDDERADWQAQLDEANECVAIILAKEQQQQTPKSLYEICADLAGHYKVLPRFERLSVNDITVELVLLKKLSEDNGAFQRRINAGLKIMHPDRSAKHVSAGVAYHTVAGLVAWLGDHLEMQLDTASDFLTKVLLLRDWSARNGGALPSMGANATVKHVVNSTPEEVEEQNKLGTYASQMRALVAKAKVSDEDRQATKLLLRDFPRLLERLVASVSRKDQAMTTAREVHELLARGFAHADEIERWPALHPFRMSDHPKKANLSSWFNSFLLGKGSDPDIVRTLCSVDRLLTRERADFLTQRNQQRAREYKRVMKEFDQERRKRARRTLGEANSALVVVAPTTDADGPPAPLPYAALLPSDDESGDYGSDAEA